jgi:hypothetical protein
VRTPPPTVSGMKHCSAVRVDEVVHRAAVLVRGVDVEKAQLVRARGVIGLRLFHRVAGIDADRRSSRP